MGLEAQGPGQRFLWRWACCQVGQSGHQATSSPQLRLEKSPLLICQSRADNLISECRCCLLLSRIGPQPSTPSASYVDCTPWLHRCS